MSEISLACLEVELHVELDDFPLDASFSACQELLVVFGPSGAGKTTILRSLAGLVTPNEGRILLNDRMLFDSSQGVNLPPQARRIGYVPQQYGLFPHMTIAENIAYGLPGDERSQRAQQLRKWIDLMRLADQADRKPTEVSGGQQQRAALARAMASGPELLLMDEPLAALDEELRTHLREEIRNLSRTFKLPILIVTHDPLEAYSLADHMVVIDRGRLIQDGSREQVFRKPATPALGRLLGMSNIYDARLLASSSETTTIEWRVSEIVLPSGTNAAPGLVKIGIRPDEIELGQSQAAEAGTFGLHGRLLEVMPTGYDQLLSFILAGAVGDQRMEVRMARGVSREPQLQAGRDYRLLVRPESIHVFPGT
jgi:molybdate transport system ATP-binding protein